MLRSGVWILLVLAGRIQDDRAAQGLLKEVQETTAKSSSLRVEGRISVEGDEAPSDATFSLRIRGKDHWAIEVREARSRRDSVGHFNILALCDGRKIVLAGAPPGASLTAVKPEDGALILRDALSTSGIFDLERFLWNESGAGGSTAVVREVKDGGVHRVGDVEARAIDYQVLVSLEGLGKVRLFVDPASKRPLKKECTRRGVKTVETYTAFAVGEEFPDSDFSFQSARRLGRVRTAELARSAALFAAYTGRHPRSLEDLLRRPADLEPEVFYPEGGFLPGGSAPKDPWGRPFELRAEGAALKLVCLGADGKPGGTGDAEDSEAAVPAAARQAVAAPTERLRNHYTARVQVQLLAGAVRLYRDATGGLPRKKADLWEKPDDAAVWPEGGYLPGGRLPLDPWGKAYRIISDADRVRVQVTDPETHLLTVKELSAEESKVLQSAARPRLSDAERRAVRTLLDHLSDDELDAREKAELELKRWGSAIHGELGERLTAEKDGETRLRIEAVRKACPAGRPTWSRELAALSVTVTAADEIQTEQALLTSCANNLAQLWKLQNVYMSQFGGRMKKMPDATGRDFWLALSRTTPPLVDPTESEIFVCPASGVAAGAGVCTYRGPTKKVAQLADADPVGMCDDEAHGEFFVVLRKSGDALVVSRADPAYEEVLKATKP